MNEDYCPDNWVVLKITNDYKPLYKVLAGWSGGYTTGDSWRMNSGITHAEDAGEYWKFYGSSGSCYRCHKKGYRLTMANSGVYNQLKENVELMDKNTNWENLEY
jgi:hypothetical protein